VINSKIPVDFCFYTDDIIKVSATHLYEGFFALQVSKHRLDNRKQYGQ